MDFSGDMLVPKRVSQKKILGGQTSHGISLFFLGCEDSKRLEQAATHNKLISVDFALRCNYNRPLKYQSIKNCSYKFNGESWSPRRNVPSTNQTIPTKPEKSIQPWTTRTPGNTSNFENKFILHPAKLVFHVIYFSGNFFPHAKVSRWKEHNVY